MIDFHIHSAINPMWGCDECRLMAAARYMLAALESVIEHGYSNEHQEKCIVAEGDCLCGLEGARAAIAEAKGE